jgi:DNA helicase-2/ATP-dependent DNA helicase PcrA
MPFGLLDVNVDPEKTERPVRFSDGTYEYPSRQRSSYRNPYENSDRESPMSGTVSRPALPRSTPKRRPAGKIKLGRDITPVKPDYAKGDRVRHFKFGEGEVLDIREGGRDYEVTVDFDDHGIKKMFAGFAKLKKI